MWVTLHCLRLTFSFFIIFFLCNFFQPGALKATPAWWVNGRLEVNVNSIKLSEFHLADLNKFLISPYNYKLVNQNNAQIFFSQIIIWSSSFFRF